MSIFFVRSKYKNRRGICDVKKQVNTSLKKFGKCYKYIQCNANFFSNYFQRNTERCTGLQDVIFEFKSIKELLMSNAFENPVFFLCGCSSSFVRFFGHAFFFWDLEQHIDQIIEQQNMNTSRKQSILKYLQHINRLKKLSSVIFDF